jgi:hypothetical protein
LESLVVDRYSSENVSWYGNGISARTTLVISLSSRRLVPGLVTGKRLFRFR